MGTNTFSTWGRWRTGQGQVAIDTLPTDFSADRPLKAFIGWDGLFTHDGGVNLIDMIRAYITRAHKESCGQCFPCRLGMERMQSILERICAGQGAADDLVQLEKMAHMVMDSARCDIGQTAPRPLVDLLQFRRNDFQEAIGNKKKIPAGIYVTKVTAPCTNACPSHVNIPDYVEKIRIGRWDQALDSVRNDCSLPGVIGRVCVRPCEVNCRRQHLDTSIAIRALKRYAADSELQAGGPAPLVPEMVKDKKVAIIGAGPAGLACAFYLGRRGYTSTIFETSNEPGGMAAFGIPDYRLPRDILRGEAEQVLKMGSEIRYGVNVGVDITLADLKLQGYSAIFVGVGAPEASKMRVKGKMPAIRTS